MIVDILIVLITIASIYAGRHAGFLRRFWASVGFFGGLFVGRMLEPTALKVVSGPEDRAVMTVVVLLGSALIGLTIGEYIGSHFKRRLLGKKLNPIDNGLGSVVGVIAILVGFWLIASIFSSLPYQQVNRAFHGSRIVSGLNKILPPAPHVIANIGHLIDPNGFPDVFIHNERLPRGKVNLPELGELSTAVNSAKDSVVRITGQGCGGLVFGSGFVVGKDLVATNAHVVAGIDRPYVQDINGTRRGTVVWFDSALDLAVMRTTNLGGSKLAFTDQIASVGTPAAILGYPGGGDFEAAPAVVLDVFKARGRDIYAQSQVIRHVYEIQGEVSHGNSGGPLIGKDGKVIGLLFAESTSHEQVGYALTHTQVIDGLEQAANSTRAVDTGHCAP